jgi:hypothetical protein
VSESSDDQREASALAARVCDTLGWPAPPSPEVAVGPLEINDFSGCFWIDRLEAGRVTDGVYVKLPKHAMLEARHLPVFPMTTRDLANASAEYESLTRLQIALAGSSVQFVRPRAFLADAGAVVTERVRGRDAFPEFREWDRAARAGDSTAAARARGHLADIGAMLAKAHADEATPTTITIETLVAKVRRLAGGLRRQGAVPGRLLDEIPRRTEPGLSERHATVATIALKGIDIRNLLWKGERLVSLDPGAMKRSVREADLARFNFTLRILYWGELAFARGMTPRPAMEAAVLEGYDYDADPRLLGWFLLKESLKHWAMAYTTIRVKGWPTPMKWSARRFYVDAFYSRMTARCMAELGL